MPSKFIIFVKSIARKWFYFVIIIILIILLVGWIGWRDLTAGIIVLIIFLALMILSYIPKIYLSRKLKKFMFNYYRIEDKTIAKELGRTLSDVQEKMFNMWQKQKYQDWLIIFLNKHYIFYHKLAIEKFKEFYNKGFSDKEILDKLKEYDIETRAEVKSIEDDLIKYNRLRKREISVKEHKDKERFQNL
ncbi:MAG: hypothetical protein ACFFAH_00490 [Promethearchaeota archaeon]